MKQNEALKSVLLLAVAVFAIGGGLVYWQYSARNTAQQRVSALEAEMPDEGEMQTQLEESQSQLAEYRTKLEHLEKSIPSVAYVPTLLKELEVIGKQNNILVTGVRPVPTPPSLQDQGEKPYQELEIDITGQGTYQAVMDMVAALQTFPKILAVETVNLAPRQNARAKTKDLDASVRLKAYVFKDPVTDPDQTDEPQAEGGGI